MAEGKRMSSLLASRVYSAQGKSKQCSPRDNWIYESVTKRQLESHEHIRDN